jgi:hypothetical protein
LTLSGGALEVLIGFMVFTEDDEIEASRPSVVFETI